MLPSAPPMATQMMFLMSMIVVVCHGVVSVIGRKSTNKILLRQIFLPLFCEGLLWSLSAMFVVGLRAFRCRFRNRLFLSSALLL